MVMGIRQSKQRRKTMELLLHYVWKNRIFPLQGMYTADGRTVEVIDVGLQNRHAGPDFFNAKVKIDGTLWVGNVEMHERASDWHNHHHDGDTAYDNVVLHVCETIDSSVCRSNGEPIAQMCLKVPEYIRQNYQQLLADDRYPPCRQAINELSSITTNAWLNALCIERLEQKTDAIRQRAKLAGGDWEAAYFTTLARSFGFGVNGDAFEAWAQALPLMLIARHRDNPFQIEAIFMGQAGLLEPEQIPERHREAARTDAYFQKLREEYAFLAHKFSLKPIDGHRWKFLRMRPQNFPHIRLAQLTHLYCSQKTNLSRLVECADAKQLADSLQTAVTPYWKTHYLFGEESRENTKNLSATSLRLLLINTAVPMLFAYGQHMGDEELCDRALQILETLKAEDNHIMSLWQECGLQVTTAVGSQALIQLKTAYCDRKDCLRCRFGNAYLSREQNKKHHTDQ